MPAFALYELGRANAHYLKKADNCHCDEQRSCASAGKDNIIFAIISIVCV